MEKTLKCFLAANSCEGFVSYFNKCYNPTDNWKAYIIKGGPGTGKSSFMKKIAGTAKEKSEEFILCPCSSDPKSLDAVILPKRKTVIMDGTAPHTVDPRYPAVCEEILNFGQFWNTDKIEDATQIIEITNQNKKLHKIAVNYLKAMGEILWDSQTSVAQCVKNKIAKNFALNLCKKHITATDDTPYQWKAFLGGTTPNGIVTYPQTITQTCENIVVIADSYHCVSNIILNIVKEFALEKGHSIITLENPLLPSVTDHIIIPKLSLAIVTEDKTTVFDTNSRRIHAKRFLDTCEMNTIKDRLKLNKKLSDNLCLFATETLSKAKKVHDQLESFYISAMNFDQLEKFTQNFTEKLFA